MSIEASIILLGTRGSVPVSGGDFALFGGDTASVLVLMGKECILLDAGSGLLRAEAYLPRDTRRIHMLLSHAHTDHLIGLPSFSPLYRQGWELTIYAQTRNGRTGKQQVEALMAPPLWPTGLEAFHADVKFHPLEQAFSIGAVRVRAMEGNHPGGSSVYRLDYGDKSVVYCTDFEYQPEAGDRLATFASGCSLLIYDAHFTDRELQNKKGWGHSTPTLGARMGSRCGGSRVVLFHHHPKRTDDALQRMEFALQQDYPNCSFGKCGCEVKL